MNTKFFKIMVSILFLVSSGIFAQNGSRGHEQDEKGEEGPGREIRYFEIWHQPYGLNIPKSKREQINRELNNLPNEHNEGDNPTNKWECLGPYGSGQPSNPDHNYSGRVLDIETDNPNTGLLVASASGGLWAYAFYLIPYCLSDDISSLAIGSFDSKKNNWNTIVVGTGEPHVRTGAGFYRTTNKGVSWVKETVYGNDPSAVYKLRYHSKVNTYPNTIFAATSDGILRSDDDGVTWHYKFLGDCSDICYVESFTLTYIYTSKWGDGIYYSSDNGESWNPQTSPGLPQNNVGRTAIASRFDINTFESYIYINISKYDSNKTLGVYKSTNTGQTWTNISPPGGDFHWGQGWYNNAISINPVNINMVLVAGSILRRTSDGGISWQNNFPHPPGSDDYLHADYHTFAWSPDGAIAYTGNDGGISSSLDAGVVWNTPNNTMPITQFYSLDIDQSGNYIYGAAQDNGIAGTMDGGLTIWTTYRTGDGGGICINQYNPNNIFDCEGTYGAPLNFHRTSSINGGVSWAPINAGLTNSMEWYPKIRTPNSQPLILYTNDSSFVYQSNNAGQDWFKLNQTTFPADLLNLDVSDQPPPNGLIFASLQPTGPFDGKLLRVYDNGTWFERSSGLPTGNYVRSVKAHPSLINDAYLCVNGYNGGNKVFKTTNRGSNWINISGDLPDVPMSYCIPHPTLPGILFAGSEVGCFKTSNGGVNWIRWNNGMPASNIITEMKYEFVNGTGYIYASTYGRGVWRRAITGDDPTGITVSLPKNKIAKGLIGSQFTYDTISVQVGGSAPVITNMLIKLDTILDNNDAQLQGFLIAPNGQTDTLFFNPGPVGTGGGENFIATWLKDTGPLSIQNGTAPFTGVFRPNTGLSKFNGLNPNGNWILKIYDWGTSNTGTLEAWTMEITYQDTTLVSIHKNSEIAREFKLYQNYPNPFNPSTKIKFNLPKSSVVKMTIYDISGKELKTLINGELDAGIHSIDFDASNIASGIYFYKLTSPEFSETKKMVLIK